MAFQNENEQHHLERGVSGVGLGSGLLQVRDSIYTRNEAPNNVALWPIAFVSKTPTSVETNYSNVKKP